MIKYFLIIFSLICTTAYSQNYDEQKIAKSTFFNSTDFKIDPILSYITTRHFGTPNTYLHMGGGMDVDFLATYKSNLIFGFRVLLFNSKKKQDYPLNISAEQLETTGTARIGFLMGKWFNRFSICGGVSYTVQNIIESSPNFDLKEIQIRGWSPEIKFDFPFVINLKGVSRYHSKPVQDFPFNTHLSLSYGNLSVPEASGFLLEVGLGVRLFKVFR